MSDVTAIYICTDGQKIKEGKLEYSGEVANKDQADAKQRCGHDVTIAKISYYKVSPTGKFALFHSYKNPESARRMRQSAAGAGRAKPRAKKAGKGGGSLWTRMRAVFEEG